MRNAVISFFSGAIILMLMSSSNVNHAQIKGERNIPDTLVKYKDGTYEGQSRGIYTDEPYWGNIHIIIKNGSIAKVDFMIRDSSLHETFSKKYKQHYKGNPVYIRQVKKDSKGAKIYPGRLLKSQDINKTDATSGATWSYNIFKASVMEALKKAGK
jgi:major membrane immunogen (membrane-anchored lipoprotein)